MYVYVHTNYVYVHKIKKIIKIKETEKKNASPGMGVVQIY